MGNMKNFKSLFVLLVLCLALLVGCASSKVTDSEGAALGAASAGDVPGSAFESAAADASPYSEILAIELPEKTTPLRIGSETFNAGLADSRTVVISYPEGYTMSDVSGLSREAYELWPEYLPDSELYIRKDNIAVLKLAYDVDTDDVVWARDKIEEYLYGKPETAVEPVETAAEQVAGPEPAQPEPAVEEPTQVAEQTEQVTPEEPAIEEPAPVEPETKAVEEPVAEPEQTEQVVPEGQAIEESTPVEPETKAVEEPVAEPVSEPEQTVEEQPVIEEPAPEEQVVEEPTEQGPVVEQEPEPTVQEQEPETPEVTETKTIEEEPAEQPVEEPVTEPEPESGLTEPEAESEPETVEEPLVPVTESEPVSEPEPETEQIPATVIIPVVADTEPEPEPFEETVAPEPEPEPVVEEPITIEPVVVIREVEYISPEPEVRTKTEILPYILYILLVLDFFLILAVILAVTGDRRKRKDKVIETEKEDKVEPVPVVDYEPEPEPVEEPKPEPVKEPEAKQEPEPQVEPEIHITPVTFIPEAELKDEEEEEESEEESESEEEPKKKRIRHKREIPRFFYIDSMRDLHILARDTAQGTDDCIHEMETLMGEIGQLKADIRALHPETEMQQRQKDAWKALYRERMRRLEYLNIHALELERAADSYAYLLGVLTDSSVNYRQTERLAPKDVRISKSDLAWLINHLGL